MIVTEPIASDTAPGSLDASVRPRTRRLRVAVPALLAVGAVIATPVVLGAGGDTALRTGDVATTTTAAPATTNVGDVFSPGEATVVTTTPASTTTDATTTTPSSTTSVAPAPTFEVLPEQPPEPIAPPPDPRGFEDQIQLGSLSIPKLGVDAPLLEGIRLTTLDNGPGHWPGTAMPGEVGNVVVAAHRTSHGGPFRNIDQLVAGDVVVFNTADGESEYVVTGTQVVDPDAIWIVDPTDTPTATLFACHPPGSVAQRIVVNLELSS